MPIDPTDRSVLRTLRHRQRVQSLAAADLDALRQSFTAMYGIADDRGYGHHAGIHGLPLPIQCHHGDLLFLPWHRAYLYFFEQAMMDRVPAARLHWWDWTDQAGVRGRASAQPCSTSPTGGPRRAIACHRRPRSRPSSTRVGAVAAETPGRLARPDSARSGATAVPYDGAPDVGYQCAWLRLHGYS